MGFSNLTPVLMYQRTMGYQRRSDDQGMDPTAKVRAIPGAMAARRLASVIQSLDVDITF